MWRERRKDYHDVTAHFLFLAITSLYSEDSYPTNEVEIHVVVGRRGFQKCFSSSDIAEQVESSHAGSAGAGIRVLQKMNKTITSTDCKTNALCNITYQMSYIDCTIPIVRPTTLLTSLIRLGGPLEILLTIDCYNTTLDLTIFLC